MGSDFPQTHYRESTRVYAGVRLVGESVDPDAISSALGLVPSGTVTGDERPSQQPAWFLNSEESVASAELCDHIRYITDQLLPVRQQFVDVCAAYNVEPNLFCFASDPTSASLGLDANTIKDLAALGLDYEITLDISEPAAGGHRHIRDHRQRLLERLNSCARRPRMYGDLQAQTDIQDLAFIDRVEQQLESLGARLVKRGWWSETGFQGALTQTFGNVPHIGNIGQSPIVEIGLELGWIELDRQLEQAEYWRLTNTSLDWLDERPRSSGDLEAEYGPPSIKIGGWEVSLGFGTEDAAVPLVWFDVSSEDNVTSLRCAGDSVLDEFIFGRPSTFDPVAATASVKARSNAPNPFRRIGD